VLRRQPLDLTHSVLLNLSLPYSWNFAWDIVRRPLVRLFRVRTFVPMAKISPITSAGARSLCVPASIERQIAGD